MRANRTVTEPSELNGELLADRLGESLGGRLGLGVVVDVGVIASDLDRRGLGSGIFVLLLVWYYDCYKIYRNTLCQGS